MKTIKEWLSELPEPYKTQALANMCVLDTETESMIIALGKAFEWSRTIEGFKYWAELKMDLPSKMYPAIPPTNALSALYAIALKKGFPIDDIRSVEPLERYEHQWYYTLRDNKEVFHINFKS